MDRGDTRGLTRAGEPRGFLEEELIQAGGAESSEALGGSKLGVSPGQCDGKEAGTRGDDNRTGTVGAGS